MVDVYRLTLRQAAWYVWIPPVFACAGGFLGGWLSLRLVDRGAAAPAARFRVCLAAAVVSVATAALPWAPTPAWASAGISLGIFAVAAFSVNMYTLPLDTFGAAPAGFAISILVSSYGAVSTILGPAIGAVIDARGYSPVTVAVAFTQNGQRQTRNGLPRYPDKCKPGGMPAGIQGCNPVVCQQCEREDQHNHARRPDPRPAVLSRQAVASGVPRHRAPEGEKDRPIDPHPHDHHRQALVAVGDRVLKRWPSTEQEG